jgi:hypothetical protein
MQEDIQSQHRSDPRRASDRVQVCVWPTPHGACRKTIEQLEREGYNTSRGMVVTLQEHVRDSHLFPDGYNEFENYSEWIGLLQGFSTSLSSGWYMGSDPLYAAYTYHLSNGQVWLFTGTREQAEHWIKEHDAQLHGDGNRQLPPDRQSSRTPRPRPREEAVVPIVLHR